jgi:hypothetical protein
MKCCYAAGYADKSTYDPWHGSMARIHGTRIIVIALVLCPIAQLRAEDKDPFAVVELGAATERSIQDGVFNAGPSASVEFPVIKDWLEIETGIEPFNLAVIADQTQTRTRRTRQP